MAVTYCCILFCQLPHFGPQLPQYQLIFNLFMFFEFNKCVVQ